MNKVMTVVLMVLPTIFAMQHCYSAEQRRSALLEQLPEVVNLIDTAWLSLQLVRAEVLNSSDLIEDVRIRALLEGVVREKMSELDERGSHLEGYVCSVLGWLQHGGFLTSDLTRAVAALREWISSVRYALIAARDAHEPVAVIPPLCLHNWQILESCTITLERVSLAEVTMDERMKLRRAALRRALALGCTDAESGCCSIC